MRAQTIDITQNVRTRIVASESRLMDAVAARKASVTPSLAANTAPAVLSAFHGLSRISADSISSWRKSLDRVGKVSKRGSAAVRLRRILLDVLSASTPTEMHTLLASLREPRFAVVLFGMLASLALVLSAVGLYGVIAFGVTQRTREIGIRMALGAEPRRVARLILGNGVRLAVVGRGIGVIGAYSATRTLTALLYGVSPNDPIAFGGATLLLIAVALIAAFVPMRRAQSVDPTDAVRSD